MTVVRDAMTCDNYLGRFISEITIFNVIVLLVCFLFKKIHIRSSMKLLSLLSLSLPFFLGGGGGGGRRIPWGSC